MRRGGTTAGLPSYAGDMHAPTSPGGRSEDSEASQSPPARSEGASTTPTKEIDRMPAAKIKGTFTQVIHSPKGGVEGLLMESDGQVVQFVLAKDDAAGAALVGRLSHGQAITVAGDLAPPSSKGEAAHPVRALDKIAAVDGKAPKKTSAAAGGYAGTIVRLNYARHGAPNGYVLDSGDFIHVKPDGFAKLGLNVGDVVTADGDAHFLATGGGWAVEAVTVNRKHVK